MHIIWAQNMHLYNISSIFLGGGHEPSCVLLGKENQTFICHQASQEKSKPVFVAEVVLFVSELHFKASIFPGFKSRLHSQLVLHLSM